MQKNIMNKTVLTELIVEYWENIEEHLYWEVAYYYRDFSKNENPIRNNFWQGKISMVQFNENWKGFCQSNNLSNKDVFYAISYVLEKFPLLIERLHHAICSLEQEVSKRNDFSFLINSNCHSFRDFFKSELEVYSIDTSDKSKNISEIPLKSNTEISWENQTELSELIYVIFHSKRILKNGKPIQQKELTNLFNQTFNTDIKEPIDLVNKSVKTYKKNKDGKTFISELNSLLEEYKKKTLDKESK